MRLLLGKKNISKFSLQCQILGRVGLVRQYYSIWYWLMFLTRMIGKLPICRVIPRRLMAHGFLVLFCGFKDHQEITGFLVVSWKVTSWLGPLFCTRWLLAPRIQGVCEWRCAHRLLRCVFLTPSSDVRSPDRTIFPPLFFSGRSTRCLHWLRSWCQSTTGAAFFTISILEASMTRLSPVAERRVTWIWRWRLNLIYQWHQRRVSPWFLTVPDNLLVFADKRGVTFLMFTVMTSPCE